MASRMAMIYSGIPSPNIPINPSTFHHVTFIMTHSSVGEVEGSARQCSPHENVTTATQCTERVKRVYWSAGAGLQRPACLGSPRIKHVSAVERTCPMEILKRFHLQQAMDGGWQLRGYSVRRPRRANKLNEGGWASARNTRETRAVVPAPSIICCLLRVSTLTKYRSREYLLYCIDFLGGYQVYSL